MDETGPSEYENKLKTSEQLQDNPEEIDHYGSLLKVHLNDPEKWLKDQIDLRMLRSQLASRSTEPQRPADTFSAPQPTETTQDSRTTRGPWYVLVTNAWGVRLSAQYEGHIDADRQPCGRGVLRCQDGMLIEADWGTVLDTDDWGNNRQYLASRTDTEDLAANLSEPDVIYYPDGRKFFGIVDSSPYKCFFGYCGVMVDKDSESPSHEQILRDWKVYQSDGSSSGLSVLPVDKQHLHWKPDDNTPQ